MKRTFSKMHGAGNDFIIFDATQHPLALTPALVRSLTDRRFGIGADQLLVVAPATRPDADFYYRIFNADGSEVEHCGNGARCFLRFLRLQGLSTANPVRAQITSGVLVLEDNAAGEVQVDMGQVSLVPADLPFDTAGLESRTIGLATQWPLTLLGQTVWITPVAISNPHAVLEVSAVDDAPVASWGPAIEAHPRFSRRVNVGFLEVVDRHTVRLRVYERGAGETLACGTGACAAVVAGIAAGRLQSPVEVHVRGGVLQVAYEGAQLLMRGPAAHLFDGVIELEE